MSASVGRAVPPAAWPAWLLIGLIVALISTASYPGFMSFDSIEALRQARGAVEGSQYPPFGSYVWRVFDWVWPGPTLMQLVQNTMLFGALTAILQALAWRVWMQACCLLICALAPPILGTMVVVWKDVAVAAFFLAGFAAFFRARQARENEPARRWGIPAGFLLVFCGMAYRFNAASGALPLLVYGIWVAQPHGASAATNWRRAWLGGVAGVLVLFSLVWFVNTHRFPSLERLERNTNMDSIMRFDLIGLSTFAGRSFVLGRDGAPVDLEYLRKIYDARHLNLTSLHDSEGRVEGNVPQLSSIWLHALAEHPQAYLQHRLAVFREYIGWHGREAFYITHPSLDANPWNLTHTPNALTRELVPYLWNFRLGPLDKPWIYYGVALTGLLLMFVLRVRRYRAEATIVLASGMLYLAPMFLITPAWDLRYNFWSIWGAIVSLCFVATGFVLAALRRAGNRPVAAT